MFLFFSVLPCLMSLFNCLSVSSYCSMGACRLQQPLYALVRTEQLLLYISIHRCLTFHSMLLSVVIICCLTVVSLLVWTWLHSNLVQLYFVFSDFSMPWHGVPGIFR